MNHFNEEDFVRKGKQIYLKKMAAPSIFVHCTDRVNCVKVNEDDGADQTVEIVLETETETLERLLNIERGKNQILQQEIDEKNRLIQNLSNDLKKFQRSSLAQFAVQAHQNVEVTINYLLNRYYLSLYLQSTCLLNKLVQSANTKQ